MDINDAVPIFSKENLSYYRDEKDGFATFIPKAHPETMEMIINPTSKEILDLCDSQKSVADIIKVFQGEYPTVPLEQLKVDIVKTLSSYSAMGVITWKSLNPFHNLIREDKKDGYYITVGYESHLPRVLDFLQVVGLLNNTVNRDTYYYYCNPDLIPKQEYCETGLKQKLFGFAENLFVLWKDDKIEGLFTIGIEVLGKKDRRPGAVYLIIIKKEDNFIDMMLEYSLRIFPYMTYLYPTKVKFISAVKDNEIIGKLKQAGFLFEYSLKNEFDFDSETFVYSYFFDKEKITRLRKNIPK